MHKAVFLDRDGVINKAEIINGKPYPPKSLNHLKIITGVKDGLIALRNAGYLLIVITNQPDVSRGITSKKTVDGINDFLLRNLPLDDFLICYHDDKDNCNCRKPKPGNILLAAKKYNIDLQYSYMIGDRWRDIEAGKSAKCMTIYIDYKYNEKKPMDFDFKADSLQSASEIILNRNI